MVGRERWGAYAGISILALAFGWIEASVVVYLRAIHTPDALAAVDRFAGLPIDLVSLPDRFVVLEMAREAATILLLAATAWVAGRRRADRAGAFLLAFGVWDLAYYAVLRLVLGWPDSLGAWDVLFLIPRPWVAPVWAPMTIAVLFVASGSRLFWTPGRERRYRGSDVSGLAGSALMIVAAFLAESGAAAEHRTLLQFPVWLFSAGVAIGVAWFVRVERRAARKTRVEPWIGVRLQTIAPAFSRLAKAGSVTNALGPREHEEQDVAEWSLGFFHERRGKRVAIPPLSSTNPR